MIKVTPDSKIEGLQEALLEQNYKNLDILIPYERIDRASGSEDSKEAVIMKGSHDGKVALTAEIFLENADQWSSGGNYTYFGQLEYEEPVPEGSCLAKGTLTGTYQLGPLTFSWRGKMGIGGVDGPALNWCSVTITDSSKEIGSNAGSPVHLEFDFSGFDSKTGEQIYIRNYTHHGECDSYWIKTPYAQYGFRKASTFKECEKLDARFPDPGKTYKFQYGDNIVTGVDDSIVF